MNRKNNLWISLIALLLLATILTCICSGCGNKEAYEIQTMETESRLTVEHHTVTMDEFGSVGFADIITDNETGTQYLYYRYGSGSGLTKMEG